MALRIFIGGGSGLVSGCVNFIGWGLGWGFSRCPKEDNELELEFRRICDGANRQGKRLPFDIVFADKKTNSSGLQLADLVARPVGLSVLRPAQENRAFDVLKRKFFCSGGRECVGEGFENWGLKIYPAPESEKPR